jgi:hypothetical protein
MDFTSNIDYLIYFLVSSLHEKFLWFGLTPNAYGISKLSLQFRERNENVKNVNPSSGQSNWRNN